MHECVSTRGPDFEALLNLNRKNGKIWLGIAASLPGVSSVSSRNQEGKLKVIEKMRRTPASELMTRDVKFITS